MRSSREEVARDEVRRFGHASMSLFCLAGNGRGHWSQIRCPSFVQRRARKDALGAPGTSLYQKRPDLQRERIDSLLSVTMATDRALKKEADYSVSFKVKASRDVFS